MKKLLVRITHIVLIIGVIPYSVYLTFVAFVFDICRTIKNRKFTMDTICSTWRLLYEGYVVPIKTGVPYNH